MDYASHSYVPLLWFLLGAMGWPSLVFILCRYQFRFGDQWTLRWTILTVGLAGVVAMWIGNLILAAERARRPPAALFLIREVVFTIPYLALAVWLAIHAFHRFRHEQSSSSI